MKCCYIFSAGEYPETVDISDGAYIIACDAGYERTLELGITPSLVIGDFDSLGYIPKGDNVAVYPTEKDDTDTALAVKLAIENGCDKIIIYGALGGHLDHSIANLHIAADLSARGISCFLIGKDETALALTNATLPCASPVNSRVSVFAWGGMAKGVTITGMKYPLTDATLTPTLALGVSNEFVGGNASISVKNGTLVVIFDRPDGVNLGVKL